MNSFNYLELLPLLPEILMILGGIALLLFGLMTKGDCFACVSRLAVAVVLLAIGSAINMTLTESIVLNGMLLSNSFTLFAKVLILIGTGFCILLSIGFFHRDKENERFEFPVLMLFAAAGMMLMVSANNLLSFYMGLELQSLCLYVLAAINRDSTKSSEAGLKYFVLGALTSGLLLYGASLVYGFTGTLDFAVLGKTYALPGAQLPLGVLTGFIFIVIAVCFKISAVPFHMWTPDVYEGAPTPVTSFFAVAPKVAAIAFFARLLLEPFAGAVAQWQQVIIFVSAASMIVGALGALRQQNIKRLMAYSSIGHVGYVLMGLAAGTFEGARGVMIYLALYITMSVGMFAAIMMMHHREDQREDISSFAGLARTYPLRAMAIAIFMLSMAGIPPLAGFFGKFFVFLAAVKAGLYVLAVIGVVTSVIAAYYYLRIIKVMYFDESHQALDKEQNRELRVITCLAAVFNVIFFVAPAQLLVLVENAVHSLFS